MPARDRAVVHREVDLEVGAAYRKLVRRVVADLRPAGALERLHRPSVVVECDLLPCHFKSFFEEAFLGFQRIAEIQQPFRGIVDVPVRHLDHQSLLRTHVHIFDVAAGLHLAIAIQFPVELAVGKVAEELFVVDLQPVRRLDRGPDILIIILYFVGMRIELPVGSDHAVVTEVLVARVGVVEVAAVGVINFAAAVPPVDRLVRKVPDETALELGHGAVQVPILPEAAFRIAHGVRVFALDERLGLRGILAVLLHIIGAGVHRAEDVGFAVVMGLFVLDRPARIKGADQVVRRFEVGAVARLVAERPHDDGGVVEIPLHMAHVALQMGLLVGRVAGQRGGAVAHAVRLDIRLGYHIETILVAEVIPVRIVGIVAGAHGIDVELLHDLDVLLHPLVRHHVAAVRVEFVPVDALDQDAFPVDQQVGALDFDFAEAGVEMEGLQEFPSVVELDIQAIKIGIFGAPLVHVLHEEPADEE